ncbi:MAG TPA: hypothetical protein VHL11_24230 [Phototrophicaceae bacterium]|jgi:hypothetical protein|nr:hypothetical protein [Phototrophicaceae bacterium]
MESFSQAEWQTLKEEMRSILIGMARMRSTITYSDLAAAMQTVHMHHRAPYFHKLLRDMDREETRGDHPSLATLVVRKDTGIPGDGYFAGAPTVEGQTFDPEAYWKTQFDEVCDYWGEK